VALVVALRKRQQVSEPPAARGDVIDVEPEPSRTR
jgi:hypothetical protein